MILAQWDADEEFASVIKLASLFALVVAGRDAAMVQLYERSGKIESDAGTDIAVVRVGSTLVEALEDGFQLVLRDADAAILHADVGMVPGMGEREQHMSA